MNRGISLSEFQTILGNTIRMNSNLQNVWVIAEMSDVRVSGGHCYMDLIEKDTSGTTRAKMRAAIWSGTLIGLRSKFLAATGKDIQTGLKVMVRGSATHHNVYGLSFVINDIDPSYTLGDLERLRREILERLLREGKLQMNRKLAVPELPQRIAVISAGGAAGYGDFINQIENTQEGFKFYPYLFSAVMQGDRTSESVRSALDSIESTIDLWDCVVIIRGGGSTTDLNGFDDYALAERVATFPLPIIVGIGHERDRTVLDELACVRCKTPTAVAAFITDRVRESYKNLGELVRRVAQYSFDHLRGEAIRLSQIEGLLPAKVNAAVHKEEKYLGDIVHKIDSICSRKVMSEQNRVEMLKVRMETSLKGITAKPQMHLTNLENMFRVLSPANTLRRGYSITRVNGKAVLDATELKPGDEITTRLLKGEIRSKIL